MNRHPVAAMLQETTTVLGADRRERRTDRLDQGLFRPGFSLAHEPLDLRERFLDGVEIRRA